MWDPSHCRPYFPLSSKIGLLACIHALKFISHLFLYVKWCRRLMAVKWEMEGMWPVHDRYIAYMPNNRYYPPCREVNDDGDNECHFFYLNQSTCMEWMPLLPQSKYMHGPMYQRLVICVTTMFTFALNSGPMCYPCFQPPMPSAFIACGKKRVMEA